MNKLERINKYLSEMGVCSRREVDELIETGRVDINGQPAHIGMQVDTEHDKVYVDGQLVKPTLAGANAIGGTDTVEKVQPWWKIKDRKFPGFPIEERCSCISTRSPGSSPQMERTEAK